MKKLIIPIIFLLLFVIFVYGTLFVGLLGLANWCLHLWQHSSNLFIKNLSIILIQKGFSGLLLVALGFLFFWILINFAISNILYYALRLSGKKIAAYKTYTITLMALFHIFAMPIILWSIIRKNSTYLTHIHYQKLRKLASSPMMQERLIERKSKISNRT